MADLSTPNFGLTLPTVGADRDTWGTLLNQNFTTLDTFVGYAAPIGMIIDFAGPNAPAGYLVCDGRLISRVTYSALFAVIGTYWGAGDGSTTFALPPMNGRALVGPGAMTDSNGGNFSFTFAQITGAVRYTVAQANLPGYMLYSDNIGSHAHGGVTAPGGNHTHSTDAQGGHNHGGQASWNQTGISAGVSDPGHTHTYYHAAGGGVGGGASGTPLANFGDYTGASGTGISVSINDPGHVHGISWDGQHAHNISYSGNLQLGINSDGLHSHQIWSGGSNTPLTIQIPIAVVTKCIYAGSQAATRLSITVAPTIEGTAVDLDEVAQLREEIAELKQLLLSAPAVRQHLARTPLRGGH